MAGSTLRELGFLTRSTPGPSAPAAEVADWYERKAGLLDRLAAEDPAGTDFAAMAAAARRHARELTAESTQVTNLKEAA